MIIVCPHCQTRYQVARNAIGAVGRKVVCAQCTGAWRASDGEVDEDTLFDPAQERQLDREFEALEQLERARRAAQAVAKPPATVPGSPARTPSPATAPVDEALLHRMQRDYFRRETSLWRRLPFARLRRTGRLLTSAMLCGTIAVLWLQRTELVRAYPDLAGLYSSVGLDVNIVGLEIADLSTMRSRRGDTDLVEVRARIRSVSDAAMAVPGVIVTMLDAKDLPIYEWSVETQAKRLEPGAELAFSTELPSPPNEATRVRLTFATGRVQSVTSNASNPQGAH